MARNNKNPSENTLRRWNKQCREGTATQVTERKLVEYVRYCASTLGFKPVALMPGYLEVAHKYPWENKRSS